MTSNNLLENDIAVYSSWSLECEGKKLRDTLTLSSSNESVDLDNIVHLDTCVHLARSEKIQNDEPCSITIKISEPVTETVSHLVVVSEARIVELFGICGEYLATYSAKYVDDFEDCAVYMADCSIKPCKQFTIKFQKTKHTNSMWLYGMNLKVCQNNSALPPLSSINFQRVNEILKEAKVPLSENAEKCKEFLQAYSGTFDHMLPPPKSKAPNPQMLMKMLEAGYINSLGEKGRNMSKCISNFVPFLSREGDTENRTMPDSSFNQNPSEHSNSVLVLKSYIDQRFTEIESKIDRFEKTIKDLETRQNEKLDCIISLLNKLTC